MNNLCLRILFLLLTIVLLSGCAGSPGKTTYYYLIDPVDFAIQPVPDARPLSIEIVDLHIPQYLEGFHIATRVRQGRLVFSEYHQWGENLRKNLLRTLARNLSRLLASNDISTPVNRSASKADYRLQIYIEQFELDSDNSVKLVARWQLVDARTQQPLEIFATELSGQKTIKKGDYDAMVAVMRELYGQLSEQISSTILAQELQ